MEVLSTWLTDDGLVHHAVSVRLSQAKRGLEKKFLKESVCMCGASVSEGLFLPWCPVNIFKSLRPTCIYISVICTLPWLAAWRSG